MNLKLPIKKVNSLDVSEFHLQCPCAASWLRLHCRLGALLSMGNANIAHIYEVATPTKWLKVFKNPLVFFRNFQPFAQKAILKACVKGASSLQGA